MKAEVESTLKKMKRNKDAGPDEIVTEMLIALGNFGTETVTELVNRVHDSEDIPDNISKTIFIALRKKLGAISCELHRKISLMSHVIKLILKIIMYRARGKIRREIGKEQCGFMEDTGTRNTIFMTRVHDTNADRRSNRDAERHIPMFHRLHQGF